VRSDLKELFAEGVSSKNCSWSTKSRLSTSAAANMNHVIAVSRRRLESNNKKDINRPSETIITAARADTTVHVHHPIRLASYRFKKTKVHALTSFQGLIDLFSSKSKANHCGYRIDR
jgi:hypothetical protein